MKVVAYPAKNELIDAIDRHAPRSDRPAEQRQVWNRFCLLVALLLGNSPVRDAVGSLKWHLASPKQTEIGRVHETVESSYAGGFSDSASDLVEVFAGQEQHVY